MRGGPNLLKGEKSQKLIGPGRCYAPPRPYQFLEKKILVKYLLTSTGSADYFGEGIAGTLTQDYELSGVGEPVTIQLPAGCPGGKIDAPLLPGAANVVNTPGVLTYDTSSSVAEAAAFYQNQMAGLGWTLPNPADVTPTGASLYFQKGNQDLNVSITTNNGVTTVNLLLVRT